ncbi:MAG TPA: hypothetical protein VGS27_04675 [Candidatus Sulfotelmatobacter sp.]|nr:hypothetical protein [Candidatus Sulfotelmatobacter sp.]
MDPGDLVCLQQQATIAAGCCTVEITDSKLVMVPIAQDVWRFDNESDSGTIRRDLNFFVYNSPGLHAIFHRDRTHCEGR